MNLSDTILRLHIMIRYKYQKNSALLQMFRYDLRPFTARMDSFIIPDAVSVLCHTFDHRKHTVFVFMTVTYKYIGGISLI